MYNDLHRCMIVFSSSTSLQRAQNVLRRAEIKTTEVKPPPGLTGGSCAYALALEERHISRARKLIGEIPHGGVYCRIHGGYREL